MDKELSKALKSLGFTIQDTRGGGRAQHVGGTILWVRDSPHTGEPTIQTAWLQHGEASCACITRRAAARGVEACVALARKLLDMSTASLVPCCGKDCSLELSPSEVVHSHYSMQYCAVCSAHYKRDNSGLCSMCDAPFHSCVC